MHAPGLCQGREAMPAPCAACARGSLSSLELWSGNRQAGSSEPAKQGYKIPASLRVEWSPGGNPGTPRFTCDQHPHHPPHQGRPKVINPSLRVGCQWLPLGASRLTSGLELLTPHFGACAGRLEAGFCGRLQHLAIPLPTSKQARKLVCNQATSCPSEERTDVRSNEL